MSMSNILSTLGPLAAYYEDPTVSEIMVDSPDSVVIERSGKLEDTPLRFDPPETLRMLIDELLALTGVKLAPGETLRDIRLPDNFARVQIVLPPTALNGPCLVIRKMFTHQVTWEMLFKFGALTQEAYDLLQSAIRADVNILIAGNMSSGKTTITNRLVETIPAEKRLVVVEAAHTYQIDHPRTVYLEAAATRMSLRTLLDAAANMRPDWLIVSELETPDAARVLELFRSGHVGITNIHGNDPEDTLTRLESLCLMANLGLGLPEIRSLIVNALRLLVQQTACRMAAAASSRSLRSAGWRTTSICSNL